MQLSKKLTSHDLQKVDHLNVEGVLILKQPLKNTSTVIEYVLYLLIKSL